jgi:hypothetical protein
MMASARSTESGGLYDLTLIKAEKMSAMVIIRTKSPMHAPCSPYACARAYRVSLLSAGGDFSQTDIEIA